MSKTHKDLNVGDEFWIRAKVREVDDSETEFRLRIESDLFCASEWMLNSDVDSELSAFSNQPNTPTAPRTMKVIEWGEFPCVEFIAGHKDVAHKWSEGFLKVRTPGGSWIRVTSASLELLNSPATEAVQRVEFEADVPCDDSTITFSVPDTFSGKTVKVIVEALP